jgi:hypothetical protein
MEKFESLLEKYRNEIAEAITKEFPNGQSYFWDYNDKLTQEQFKEVMAYKRKNNSGTIEAIDNVLDDVLLDQRVEMINDIEKEIISFLNKKENLEIDEEDFYDELTFEEQSKLTDIAWENLNLDNSNLIDLVDNIKFSEATVKICPTYYFEDSYDLMEKYQTFEGGSIPLDNLTEKGLNKVVNNLNDLKKPDIINWLCQTQGYELSDLYDENKIKNSKFLSSLKSELCDCDSNLENMYLTISSIGANFESVEAINSKKNLLISPEKNAYIGLFDPIYGGSCDMQVKLEKDLIIPEDWIIPEYHITDDNSYSVQGVNGFRDSDPDIFKTTNKEALKPTAPNIEKLRSIAQIYDQNREEIGKINENIQEKENLSTTLINGNNPSIQVFTDNDLKEDFNLGKELLNKYDLKEIQLKNRENYNTLYLNKSTKEVTYTIPFRATENATLKQANDISKEIQNNVYINNERKDTKFIINNDKLNILGEKFEEKYKELFKEIQFNNKKIKENDSIPKINKTKTRI